MNDTVADIVSLNGTLQPLNQTKISPLDYGFLYGFGLFETMRAYDGLVFLLDQHLDRLYQSARTLGFPPLPRQDGVADAVEKTIIANGLKNARVRLTVSMGEGAMVPDTASCKSPTVLISARPLVAVDRAHYEKGFSAVLSSYRRDSQSPISRMKTCNYLNSLLARTEARSADAAEAVMPNEKGWLAECSSSNLFLVMANKVYTPPVESGLLPGITRAAVVELAKLEGIELKMRDMPVEALQGADEAFLTNSILEIMPLTLFQGKPVGDGRPGPITRKLMGAYSKLIETTVSR